jgi:selenophosphate synthetase-related protein
MAALGLRYLGRMLRAAGDRLDPDGGVRVVEVEDLRIAFGDSAVIIRMDSDPFLVVSAEGVKHG